jgi:two-component system sensor histidine kinase RpfC
MLIPPLAAVTAPAGEASPAKARFLALMSHEWHARLDGALAAALGETVEAPEPARRAAPALPAPARSLRILVAESSGADRKILRRVLEAAGHHVAMVENGEATLAALDRYRFELALIDIDLPRSGGRDVSKLYRMEHLGESRLPIIALAADPGIETERLCREAGMDAVLGKPIETAQLLAAIDEIHARVTGGADAARARVVTPISAHPRYFADAGAVVDEATIEALRLLGGSSDFLGDVIDAFCSDARRLLEQLRQAVAEGDLPTFKDLVHSLRSGAANLGAARFCQILTELRDITGRDLRLDGPRYIEKLVSEFAKLETVLSRVARESRIA